MLSFNAHYLSTLISSKYQIIFFYRNIFYKFWNFYWLSIAKTTLLIGHIKVFHLLNPDSVRTKLMGGKFSSRTIIIIHFWYDHGFTFLLMIFPEGGVKRQHWNELFKNKKALTLFIFNTFFRHSIFVLCYSYLLCVRNKWVCDMSVFPHQMNRLRF